LKLFPDTTDLADIAAVLSNSMDKFSNPSCAEAGYGPADPDRDVHRAVLAEFGEENYQRGSQ